MSLDLFRVIAGVNIQSDTGTITGSLLSGSGAPGGDTSFQDAATIGSLYLRTDTAGSNLQLYSKFASTNSAADWRQITDKTYVDAVTSALSTTRGDGNITTTGGNYSLSSDLVWVGGSPTGTLNLTTALDQLNIAVGNRTYTQRNVVADGQTIAASINALDVAVGSVANPTITATNVNATGTVTADSIAVTTASQIKWHIQVRETGTPANRRSYEVHALSDGTNVDHALFAGLRLATAPAGLVVAVDVTGGNLRLRVTATPNIDYVVKRVAYSAF